MKTAYSATKILLIFLIVLYIFALLFYPVTMALFTTEGYGSLENFVKDTVGSFAYITPLIAIIFIPCLALRSYLAYKLTYIEKRTFVNRTYVMIALEVVLILGLFVWVMITKYSMGVQMTSV